jgi:arsenate reductase
METMSHERRRVLFLCAGNSCRSQMAEAIVNAKFSAHWQAYSAGTRPAGLVHPMALEVLAESGINHKGRSKGMDSIRGIAFDLIVTLCDEAREQCPAWFGPGEVLHHEYADPAAAEGTASQRLDSFRKIRDAMFRDLPYMLEQHAGHDLS